MVDRVTHWAGERARRVSIQFSGGRPLRVPPEVRAPSMAIGNELGRVGGVRRGVLGLVPVDGRQQVGRYSGARAWQEMVVDSKEWCRRDM